MSRLRIAVLSDAIYPYHHGGKETLQYERAVRLARRGHAVRLHTMHWWPEPEGEIVRNGIVLNAIAPRVAMYLRGGGRSIWQSIVVGLGSLRLLWSPAFDVLDVDQFPFTPFFAARLVCTLRRRPMTATWYEVWDLDYWRDYMGWLGRVGLWLQRFAARSADFIFADSALTARRLTELLGVDPSRIAILSPGTSIQLQTPSAVARASQTPSGGGGTSSNHKNIDCLYIGRLLPHKHVDVFLRALAQLPGVTGLVVGSGPEKDRLMTLTHDLRIADRVSFESPQKHQDVVTRLRACRLLVSPSTREGFGVAVLEANACGVPALIVQHPDNAALELVRPGENGLISELDPKVMASHIHAYLTDELAQVRMSKSALAAAAGYSWDAYVDRMEAALEALTAPAFKKAA